MGVFFKKDEADNAKEENIEHPDEVKEEEESRGRDVSKERCCYSSRTGSLVGLA